MGCPFFSGRPLWTSGHPAENPAVRGEHRESPKLPRHPLVLRHTHGGRSSCIDGETPIVITPPNNIIY